MLITIITLNGKAFQFEADRVEAEDDIYTFWFRDEIVGSFWIKGIAGYYSAKIEDEEDEMD